MTTASRELASSSNSSSLNRLQDLTKAHDITVPANSAAQKPQTQDEEEERNSSSHRSVELRLLPSTVYSTRCSAHNERITESKFLNAEMNRNITSSTEINNWFNYKEKTLGNELCEKTVSQ